MYCVYPNRSPACQCRNITFWDKYLFVLWVRYCVDVCGHMETRTYCIRLMETHLYCPWIHYDIAFILSRNTLWYCLDYQIKPTFTVQEYVAVKLLLEDNNIVLLQEVDVHPGERILSKTVTKKRWIYTNNTVLNDKIEYYIAIFERTGLYEE